MEKLEGTLDPQTLQAIKNKKKETPQTPKTQSTKQNIQQKNTQTMNEQDELLNVQNVQNVQSAQNETDFPFEAVLGINKKVRFKAWTGKTKKRFRRLFINVSSLEDVDLKEVSKVLVSENLDKPDIYLSADEQQYLLALLKKESIEDEFDVVVPCPKCLEDNTINTSVTEAVHFKPGKYPQEIDFMGKTEFVDIGTISQLEKAIQNVKTHPDYDGVSEDDDIEFAMHVHFMSANSIIENLKIIDGLSIKQLKELISYFKEVAPQLKMEVKRVCTHCGTETVFPIAEIPGIFEELLS